MTKLETLEQIEKLTVIKPKTRPIQIEPWFFKYLNEGQLKVVSAILNYADTRDRTSNSFPSNRTIAFYCGFGDLKENTKAYSEYLLLTDEEKIKYKNKRIKTAIITVANIKKDLENIGLLTRKLVGQRGKQVCYMELDLEWKKEQYLKEHDEFFNNVVPTADNEKEEINKQLEELLKLAQEDNISKDNLATRLKELSKKLQDDKNSNPPIPSEDVEKVTDFIMESTPVKNKIETGKIQDKNAYKNRVKNLIENNKYEGIEDTYSKLVNKEREQIFDTLQESLSYNEPTIPYKNQILNFIELTSKNNIYIAKYLNPQNSKKIDFILSNEKIKQYLPTPNFYSKPNKELLENYEKSIIDYQKSFIQEQDGENSS